jgi:hypothetical protein
VHALRRRLRRPARRVAQILEPHRDALAVEAQDQQVIARLGLARPIAVERVQVLRRSHRQFFHLSLRHLGAALFLHQLDDLVERRPRALLGHDPAHLVRVLLGGQLHRRVQRRQPLDARRLVQVALVLDLAEARLDRPRAVANLRALHAVGAAHLHVALLRRAQREVRLHHRAHEFLAEGGPPDREPWRE